MNELLNRLKNSVNLQILNKVNNALLEQYKFVPISVKDNFLFVAINSSSDKDVINLKLKEFFPQQVKFIQVPDQDLFDLISSLKQDMQKEQVDDGTSKQVRLGELLIQKGYINDVQLDDYVDTTILTPGVAANPYKLADDEYFVLGDNRNNSEDSRFASVGMVKRKNVVGKVWMVIEPFDSFGFVK